VTRADIARSTDPQLLGGPFQVGTITGHDGGLQEALDTGTESSLPN
jgi:hypothetical protein